MIVAYDQNRGIGADNDLLWQRDLPADLNHFRKHTTGRSIIMGRLTFESIGLKPLPNRQNIVVSSRPVVREDVIWVPDLDSAFRAAKHDPFVIGGASIYSQALDVVGEIYATEVRATFPAADKFFPELGPEWSEVARESHLADQKNLYNYDFVTYRRQAK